MRTYGSSTSIGNDMRANFGRSNVAMVENFLNRPDILFLISTAQ